jgi:Aldehyde dehydrogenase family
MSIIIRVAFAAMGTAGQRCTTLRRLFVHESIYESFVPRLQKVYASFSVGNPSLALSLTASLTKRCSERPRPSQSRGCCHYRRATASPSRARMRPLTYE